MLTSGKNKCSSAVPEKFSFPWFFRWGSQSCSSNGKQSNDANCSVQIFQFENSHYGIFKWINLPPHEKMFFLKKSTTIFDKDDSFSNFASGRTLSIHKSAFRSSRTSEPIWRIILRAYYGVAVLFVSEEKSWMTMFIINE